MTIRLAVINSQRVPSHREKTPSPMISQAIREHLTVSQDAASALTDHRPQQLAAGRSMDVASAELLTDDPPRDMLRGFSPSESRGPGC
jgi:hypothetical protein